MLLRICVSPHGRLLSEPITNETGDSTGTAATLSDGTARLLCESFQRRLENQLGRLPDKPTISKDMIESNCTEIVRTLENELRAHKFAIIDRKGWEYFEADALFDELVDANFPSAKSDIKASGNCIAADLNTAAVYHLMCVVEIGLRGLASHLKVRAVKMRVPIEQGTWEEIITTLEKKLELLGQTTRSKKRQAELDFYNELLKEFRSIKDLWRNKVMHARVSYDAHQAQSAFDHVKAFMQRLATKISETK